MRAKFLGAMLLSAVMLLPACVNTSESNLSKLGTSPQTESSDIRGTLSRADAAYAARDWTVAKQEYEKLSRLMSKDPHAWFRLGNIYAHLDQPDFAVQAYKESLVRDPRLGKAWHNMGLVQLRQSANSFLQMQTYTGENPEQQVMAKAMYEALLELIKSGPGSSEETGGIDK